MSVTIRGSRYTWDGELEEMTQVTAATPGQEPVIASFATFISVSNGEVLEDFAAVGVLERAVSTFAERHA